jgi:hypothetical protein
MLSGEATNTNFIVFGLTVIPQSTTLEASTLTITQPMRFGFLYNNAAHPIICVGWHVENTCKTEPFH